MDLLNLFIATIIGGIGLYFAIKSFSKDHGTDRANDKVKELKFNFFSARNLSLKCSDTIDSLINEYGIENEIFLNNVSFKVYSNMLKQSQKTELSNITIDNALNSITPFIKEDLAFRTLDSMNESVKNQLNELVQLDNYLIQIKNTLIERH